MNKSQLIASVAADLGESKAAAARAVEAVINSIAEGLKNDDAVTISGFGTFSKRNRSARTVRSPSTGELIEVKSSRTVGFKPSQSLKKGL
jgi:DNA-binding protein HU-beta